MKTIKFSKKYFCKYNELYNIKDCSGIYILTSGNFNVYVGLAERQLIKDRLKNHFNTSRTHNKLLKYWLKSDFTKTYFQYYCYEKERIRELETFCIVKMQPLANFIEHKQKNIENNYFRNCILMY